MFMVKSKVSIKIKMKITIQAVFHSYRNGQSRKNIVSENTNYFAEGESSNPEILLTHNFLLRLSFICYKNW